ncbi:MAG: hypothetical protein HY699_23820 [Deltaproteobacteria bacterium]|nr:hypothetical protein [Deltaproteobacteria bacterium]
MAILARALRATTDAGLRDRFSWAVRVRWLVIGGFLVLAAVAHWGGLSVSLGPCLIAALVGSAINAANHWCVTRWRAVLPVTALALGVDLLLITYVTLNTGGVRSPFVIMYVVQVLATAMLVDTAVAAVTAVAAAALFGAAMGAEAIGLYAGGSPIEDSLVYRATWSAFLLYALALLVYLGGYVSQRLSASERDLAEKNRKLEETLAAHRAANRELAAAYERLKQTEAHLIQSEKMHALGQLVAGVAHELNNPISFVSANIEHLRGYIEQLTQLLKAYDGAELAATERAGIEQLKRTIRLPDVLADLPSLLRDCEEGAQRTKRIVTELRTFSRSEETDRWRRVDIHHCIESTLGLLNYRLKDRVTLHRDYATLPEVECIPGQINQVLMNLLANAVDAIGRSGNIWISSRLSNGDSRGVEVAIRDDGVGIPADLHRRIFDPFFTTKEVGKGTGLGLSVSYSIVERHGGKLSVESLPGHGSTFTLALPIDQPQPE